MYLAINLWLVYLYSFIEFYGHFYWTFSFDFCVFFINFPSNFHLFFIAEMFIVLDAFSLIFHLIFHGIFLASTNFVDFSMPLRETNIGCTMFVAGMSNQYKFGPLFLLAKLQTIQFLAKTISISPLNSILRITAAKWQETRKNYAVVIGGFFHIDWTINWPCVDLFFI